MTLIRIRLQYYFKLVALMFGVCYANWVVAQVHKPEVLLIMSSHASKPKGDLLRALANDQPFEFTVYSTQGKSDEQVKLDWSKADLVMLDGMNPALSKYMFGKYEHLLTELPNLSVISLGDLQNNIMNQGLSEEHKHAIGAYYQNAGRENYHNMMVYIANEVFDISALTAQPVQKVPDVGLYHYALEGLVTNDETTFFQFLNPLPSQPVIAIGIHRSVIDYEQQHIVDSLIESIEEKGAKAFAFFLKEMTKRSTILTC